MKNLNRTFLTVFFSASMLLSASAHLSIGGVNTDGNDGTLFIMIDSNVEVLDLEFTVSGMIVTSIETYNYEDSNTFLSVVYSDSIVSRISSNPLSTFTLHKGLLATLSFTGFDGGEICIIDTISGYATPATCEDGDVNGDGTLNILDHKLIIDYVLGYDVMDIMASNWWCADINGDNAINLMDANYYIYKIQNNPRNTYPIIVGPDYSSIPVTIGGCIDGNAKIAFVQDDGFPTIKDAIDIVNGSSTIQVAPGTYSGEGNTALDFDGKNISLIAQAGPKLTIIDCESTDRGITFWNNEDSTSILDGFTIMNGKRSEGGGIYIDSASPTIRNCIISNCIADNGGGGIFLHNSNAILKGLYVTDNIAKEGGGIDIIGGSPIITNSVISDNISTIYSGGGIHISEYSRAYLSHLNISGNHGHWHGGIFIWTGSKVIISNSIIFNNTQSEHTGAIGVEEADVNLFNLTITDNSIGGVSVWNGANLNIVNSIITNHPEEEIMVGSLNHQSNYISIAYSNIEDGLDGIWQQGPNDHVSFMDGNIVSDPLFKAKEKGNYTLRRNSPCIDAGTADLDGDGIDDITIYYGSAPDIGFFEHLIKYIPKRPLTKKENQRQLFMSEKNSTCVTLYKNTLNINNFNDIINIYNCIEIAQQSTYKNNASHARLIIMKDKLYIKSNGFISGIKMTLSHEANFDIKLTSNAHHTNYLKNNTETTLIIITPETDELFSFSGDFEISDIIVANTQYEVPISLPIATSYSLSEAYPNPFNPTTTLSFNLPIVTDLSLIIYNLAGRKVKTLVNGNMEAGYHSVVWNADSYSSGVYLVKMVAGEYISTQKLMLVK